MLKHDVMITFTLVRHKCLKLIWSDWSIQTVGALVARKRLMFIPN